MSKQKLSEELNQTFLNERHIDLVKLGLVLKQDIFSVVNSYLDVRPTDLLLSFDLNSSGEYELKCKVRTKRIKLVGFIK